MRHAAHARPSSSPWTGFQKVLAIAVLAQRFILQAPGALLELPLTVTLCAIAAPSAQAGKATTGNWIGPFSMGHTPANTYTQARATYLTLLRRQTASGDSALVVHWHEKNKVRAWSYAYGADGSFVAADTTSAACARILSDPAQNVFCSGLLNLLDGRLMVAGGTAPGAAGVVGTTEVVTFDPNQSNLWTSTNSWAVQDTMRFNRWYPNLTNLADGTAVVTSGVEYFEMPVIGGLSPADSTQPFLDLSSLGLSRSASWPSEPRNTILPRLRDHTSVATAQIQMLKDGRGAIVTFGGISDALGTPLDKTWLTWDVAVDPNNSWLTREFPLTTGSTTRPPARSQHSASVLEVADGLSDHELQMFVYGGLDAGGHALDDLWRFRCTNGGDSAHIAGTWAQFTPSGPSPGPRYGHTMVFDPGPDPSPSQPARYPKMLVFGGKRNTTTWAGTDTVFVLQLWGSYAWHALVLGGSSPAPRYRHAATFDHLIEPGQSSMRMTVFGGAASNPGHNASVLGDTWTLLRSLSDSLYTSWTWLQESAGSTALPVYKQSMIMDDEWNRLTMFGGDRTTEDASGEANTGGETNDSFVRSVDVFTADHTWKQLATTSPVVRRSGHSAVYYWGKGYNARLPEHFDPRAVAGQHWSTLSSSPKFDRPTYPFMFAVPDGRLFYAGRQDTSEILAASLTGAWSSPQLGAGSTTTIVGDGGTAAQYAPGKIIKVGGNGTANGIVNLATFAGSSYTWTDGSRLGLLPRGNPNATILPNGQVLVTGGRNWDGIGNHDGSNGTAPVKTPQAWSPAADAWTTGAAALADEPAVRGYHSTAILLPDARVLSAGGNPGSPQDDYELGTIFEPPYLFDPSSAGGNAYATRPTIDVAPRWIGHDCPFTLSVTSATGVSSVCLIRAGAPTHAFNQDQVFVPLSFTQSGSDLTVTGPAGPYIAPPGDYLLFVLDNTSQQVPSVARWVRVAEAIWPFQAADDTIPARITTLGGSNGFNGDGCSQPVTVTWLAPCDDSTRTASGRVRRLDLRYSTSSICDNCWSAFAAATQIGCEPPAGMPFEPQSMDIAGLGIGSYQFRMVSQDDRSATGNISGMSNPKTLHVFGCVGDGFYAGGGGGGAGGFSARAASLTSLAGASYGGVSENSLLPPSGGGPSTDVMRLVKPRIEGGRITVRMRRGTAGETHVLDARLVAVDHASTSEVFHIGDTWRLGERRAASAARGTHGEDVSGLLGGDPSSCLVGDSGDTVSITLPSAEGTGSPGVLYLEAQSGRIADVTEPGLSVLQPDSTGAWHELARQLPRSGFSTLVVSGIVGNDVKLVFSGNHAIGAVGRLVLGDAPLTTVQSAVAISHFRLGALDPAVLGDGGSGLDLMPRDTVEVAFDLPASQPTDTRDWFLQLTGTSTTGSVLAARATPAGPTGGLPASLRLEAPSPNPFSNGTRLRLGLPQAAMVQVEVFDLAGRRVATVVHEHMSAGWHELSWNGQSRAGGHVEAGIYVCRLVATERSLDRKVVYLP